MKYYDFALAPNPRRVNLFLREKGIELGDLGRERLGAPLAGAHLGLDLADDRLHFGLHRGGRRGGGDGILGGRAGESNEAAHEGGEERTEFHGD